MMHASITAFRLSRWRWTVAGVLLSFVSIFFVPFRFSGLNAVDVWLLWVLFPYGMICQHHQRPGLIEPIAWLGPPALYGLILSAASDTRYARLTFYVLLALHTIAAVLAATI